MNKPTIKDFLGMIYMYEGGNARQDFFLRFLKVLRELKMIEISGYVEFTGGLI